jgi:hypothetical protein
MQVQTRRTVASATQYSVERRYPRHFLSVPVITWRLLNSGAQVTHGLTLEISIGGLSAVLCGPPLVGERVSLRVQLLGSALETPAIVRYGTPARTGFEFLELPPEFLRSIQSCIHRLLLRPWPRDGFQPT